MADKKDDKKFKSKPKPSGSSGLWEIIIVIFLLVGAWNKFGLSGGKGNHATSTATSTSELL